jgi:hypothetical protein
MLSIVGRNLCIGLRYVHPQKANPCLQSEESANELCDGGTSSTIGAGISNFDGDTVRHHQCPVAAQRFLVCWSRRARKLAARPVDIYAGMRTGTADVGRDDMPVDCSRDGRGARLFCFEIWEGPSRRGAFTIEMQIGLREKHQENIHQLLHFSTSWKK